MNPDRLDAITRMFTERRLTRLAGRRHVRDAQPVIDDGAWRFGTSGQAIGTRIGEFLLPDDPALSG
jgi:hypothetical protein